MLVSLPSRLAFFSCLLLATACDRRLEPFVAPEDEPARLERPVRVPGLENPAPRASMPMGPPESAGARAGTTESDGAPIRGVIAAGDGVEPGGDGVLFLIARSGGGGPPLAVKRLPVGPFPIAFEIGPADVMVQGRAFAGPITLSARVDRDGNAMTREPGDPHAELSGPVEPGTQGIELRLQIGDAPAAPAAPAATAAPADADGGAPIRGVIAAGEGVEPGGTGVLFLIARSSSSSGGGGPPLAAKRLPLGPFPLAFEIGPADVMVPGRAFAGPITLSARVDRDGNASTREPGEPHAELPAPVQPGSDGVQLTLRVDAPAP